MKSTQIKFEEEVEQKLDFLVNGEFPTIVNNYFEKESNYDLLNDRDEGEIESKFYKEYENIFTPQKQSLQTDTEVKKSPKKYQSIKLIALDVTSLTNDV